MLIQHRNSTYKMAFAILTKCYIKITIGRLCFLKKIPNIFALVKNYEKML